MKTKILFLGMLLALLSTSCTKVEDPVPVATTTEDAGVDAKMNMSNDDVSKIVEDQFQLTSDNATSGRTETASSFLASCATVTRVPAFGTAPTVGQTITKTIVFDPAGCQLPNGNIVKGTIIISFLYQPSATSHTINYQFVNFYHNDIKYEGNKNFTWVWNTSAANSNAHAIVTMNMDMTATFPSGGIYHRVGSRVSEIIAGDTTPIVWDDNVYQVTGSWVTTFPDGVDQTSTITTPLHVKFQCITAHKYPITYGVITFLKSNVTSTLDYGNDVCDNLVVFSIYGLNFDIIVGN